MPDRCPSARRWWATELREFVTTRWHALLRTSRELAPDLDTARRLLAEALVDAAAELRRHGPDAAEGAVLAHLSVAEVAMASPADPAADSSAEPSLDADPFGDHVLPVLRRRRRNRLRTALIAAGVVVVLAVGYAVSGAATRQEPRAYGNVLAWPTRGSLAGDQSFVAELARRASNGRVLYAGDVAGRRIGLVLSPTFDPAPAALVAFTGRAGAAAAHLTMTYPGRVRPTARVVAWADPEPDGAHVLVVLAESRARTVAVSTRAVPRLGYIDRAYVTHRMRNGVLAEPARAASVRMMRISVEGGVGSPYDGPVLGIERTLFFPGYRLPVPQRSYGDVAGIGEAWREAVSELADTYRVPFAHLVVVWRWARFSGKRTVLLAAAYRLPTGAVVLQARWWSRQLDNSIAVNRYVAGRPLLDPTEPVSWPMGDQIGVFWAGAGHRAVVLNGGIGSFPQQVVTRTDAAGYASVTVPRRMRGPWVEVPVGHGRAWGYILSTTSPFDLDPLDVGARVSPP